MTSNPRLLKFFASFLSVNLLFIRFFRPILPILSFISFRIWIDWLLLLVVVLRGRPLRLLGISGILVCIASTVIIISNLIEHGVGKFGLEEAVGIPLMLGLPLFYATVVRNTAPEALDRYLRATLLGLNVYFYVNAVIVFGQIGGYIPVPAQFLVENPSVIDHMTGLIGLNGVSTLNFIWIATIAGNFRYLRDSRWRIVAIVSQLAIGGSISLLNDNKMFVITLGISALVLMSLHLRAIQRWIPLLVLVAIIGIPYLFDFFASLGRTESGLSLDLGSIVFFDPNHLPNANNERAYQNYLAYQCYNGFGTGVGLGNANADSKEIHVHLGINSAALLLIQGGLPLLIAAGALLFVGFRAVVGKRGLMPGLTIASFTGMVIYVSNPIADRYTLTAMCLFMIFAAPRKLESQFPQAARASIDPPTRIKGPRS